MQQAPEPATKRALLPSAGVLPGILLLTRHHYIRTDTRPDAAYGTLRPEHIFVFKCEVTGAERTWGIEGMATPELFEGDLDGEA